MAGNDSGVTNGLAIIAACFATPLVLGAASHSVAAGHVGRCTPAQVTFSLERQPVNSVTTGFSVTAKTRERGSSCTVKGYPSLTLLGGAHGPVTIVSRPHLVGTGGPGTVVTLSASAKTTGGFYAVDTRACDPRSALTARVRFGLPNGGGAHGSAMMIVCKRERAVLVVGPFSG